MVPFGRLRRTPRSISCQRPRRRGRTAAGRVMREAVPRHHRSAGHLELCLRVLGVSPAELVTGRNSLPMGTVFSTVTASCEGKAASERADLFLQRFEFGNHLEVFRSSFDPLDANEPVQVEEVQFKARRGDGDRMRQQRLVPTAAGDLAE